MNQMSIYTWHLFNTFFEAPILVFYYIFIFQLRWSFASHSWCQWMV